MTNCVIIDVEKPIRCRECGEIIRWERSRTNRTIVCGYIISIRSLIDCDEEVKNGSGSIILSDNDVQRLTRLLGKNQYRNIAEKKDYLSVFQSTSITQF